MGRSLIIAGAVLLISLGLGLYFNGANAKGVVKIIPRAEWEKADSVAAAKVRAQLAKARTLPSGDLRRAKGLLDAVRGITTFNVIGKDEEIARKEAVQIMEAHLPKNDLGTAQAQYELGEYYEVRPLLGVDKATPKEWYLKAIPGFEAHLDKVLTNFTLNFDLQEMYAKTGQESKQRSLLSIQFARLKKNPKVDRASLVMGLMRQVNCDEAAKNYKQTEIGLRKVIELRSSSANSHGLAELHTRLGKTLQNQSRLNDALAEYQLALAIDEKVFPNRSTTVMNHVLSGLRDDTSPLLSDLCLIGDAYDEQGRRTEAQQTFDEAAKIAATIKGDVKTLRQQIDYVNKRHRELSEPAQQQNPSKARTK